MYYKQLMAAQAKVILSLHESWYRSARKVSLAFHPSLKDEPEMTLGMKLFYH
jgi:hypothetical protein